MELWCSHVPLCWGLWTKIARPFKKWFFANGWFFSTKNSDVLIQNIHPIKYSKSSVWKNNLIRKVQDIFWGVPQVLSETSSKFLIPRKCYPLRVKVRIPSKGLCAQLGSVGWPGNSSSDRRQSQPSCQHLSWICFHSPLNHRLSRRRAAFKMQCVRAFWHVNPGTNRALQNSAAS